MEQLRNAPRGGGDAKRRTTGFAIAVAVFMFLVGIVVGKYQYWPYSQLNAAKDAAEALWVSYFPAEKPEFPSSHTTGGVIRHDRAAASPGLTFIRAGPRTAWCHPRRYGWQ